MKEGPREGPSASHMLAVSSAQAISLMLALASPQPRPLHAASSMQRGGGRGIVQAGDLLTATAKPRALPSDPQPCALAGGRGGARGPGDRAWEQTWCRDAEGTFPAPQVGPHLHAVGPCPVPPQLPTSLLLCAHIWLLLGAGAAWRKERPRGPGGFSLPTARAGSWAGGLWMPLPPPGPDSRSRAEVVSLRGGGVRPGQTLAVAPTPVCSASSTAVGGRSGEDTARLSQAAR